MPPKYGTLDAVKSMKTAEASPVGLSHVVGLLEPQITKDHLHKIPNDRLFKFGGTASFEVCFQSTTNILNHIHRVKFIY